MNQKWEAADFFYVHSTGESSYKNAKVWEKTHEVEKNFFGMSALFRFIRFTTLSENYISTEQFEKTNKYGAERDLKP